MASVFRVNRAARQTGFNHHSTPPFLAVYQQLSDSAIFINRRMVLGASTAPLEQRTPMHSLTWHLQLSFDRWRQSWRARAKGFRVPHRAATVVLSLAWCPVAFTLGTTPSRIMTLFLHPGGASMYHRCNLSIMSACIRVNV
jgi:hypothetical protein